MSAGSTRLEPALPDLEKDLRNLVNPLHAGLPDQEVVADPGEASASDMLRMDRHIHVFLNGHGLVAADQRPLHQIVALAVRVEAVLLVALVLAHEGVEGL